MKTIQTIKTIVFLTILLFISCAKDEGATKEEEKEQAGGPFIATVDGKAFPKTEMQYTYARFIPATKMLQILGQPADQKETIVLTLMPFGGKVNAAVDWKPGTYDFDPIHVANVEYLASAEYNIWNGNGYDQWFTKWEHVKNGKIIIESNSGTQIKGKFSFDAVRKNNDGSFNAASIKKITEGSFDLTIK